MNIPTRPDLTAWVMHFVHQRNPANNPAYNINEGEETPAFRYHENHEVNARFEFWEMVDGSKDLAPDDYASEVLLKIIEDGHIRAGWLFRNNRPTIYGPRAACCFTEMPLYGLIEYARTRKRESVDTYAIGLLKDEFFMGGGRPVIYGLTGQHREVAIPPMAVPPHYRWPRKLDPACGIAEHEQYRYVAMRLEGDRRIDWSHEREWRWADVADRCSCPGLPIWLRDEPIQFSKAMIIVPTKKKANRVLNLLKELFDAGQHNYGYVYNRELLSETRVVALDELEHTALASIRLEDIPAAHLGQFQRPEANEDLCRRVKEAIAVARRAAREGAEAFAAKAPRTPSGYIADGFGWAYVTVLDPQSPFVSAMLKLGDGAS